MSFFGESESDSDEAPPPTTAATTTGGGDDEEEDELDAFMSNLKEDTTKRKVRSLYPRPLLCSPPQLTRSVPKSARRTTR